MRPKPNPNKTPSKDFIVQTSFRRSVKHTRASWFNVLLLLLLLRHFGLDAQVEVTENHVKSNTVKSNTSSVAKLGRRAVGTAGPSHHQPAPAAIAAGARAIHRRQSCSSLTSSSSLSSTASRRSVISHSSNLSYSQDDVDSTGKPHDPAAANLEIHEVKVVFLKVSIVATPSLL